MTYLGKDTMVIEGEFYSDETGNVPSPKVTMRGDTYTHLNFPRPIFTKDFQIESDNLNLRIRSTNTYTTIEFDYLAELSGVLSNFMAFSDCLSPTSINTFIRAVNPHTLENLRIETLRNLYRKGLISPATLIRLHTHPRKIGVKSTTVYNFVFMEKVCTCYVELDAIRLPFPDIQSAVKVFEGSFIEDLLSERW